MCFGFSLVAERSWPLTESWRICIAAVKASGALYAEDWWNGCPIFLWRMEENTMKQMSVTDSITVQFNGKVVLVLFK